MSHQTEHAWLSYHIFHGSGERVLFHLALPVVRDLWTRGRIVRFFFIRYSLGGPHIRLRFLCKSEYRNEIDQTLRDAAAKLFRCWPSRMRLADDEIRRRNRHFSATDEIDETDVIYPDNSLIKLPFHPETERYGGSDLIAHSLDFFCLSSAYVLGLVEQNQSEARSRRLSRAMRALLRQALGFSTDRDELPRLVAYAALGKDPRRSRVITCAEREFARCRTDFIKLVFDEIASSGSDSGARFPDYLLTDAARAFRWQISNAADPTRWQILGSQLHMTSNRLGLMNVEEVYLGHILRRAILDGANGNAGLISSIGSFSERPINPGEGALDALITESLTQLTLSNQDEVSVSPDTLQEER